MSFENMTSISLALVNELNKNPLDIIKGIFVVAFLSF
jgi:hypothetical protein